LWIRVVINTSIAADDAEDHYAGAIGSGGGNAYGIIALGRHEACHERAVTDSRAAFTFRRHIRAVFDKVPTVDVVYVSVAVVIYIGFSVCLCLVGPELIANVLMVREGTVIEHGNDDWPDHLAMGPREGASNIINPPEVTDAIRAIVRS
jgi:hypothetical protein